MKLMSGLRFEGKKTRLSLLQSFSVLFVHGLKSAWSAGLRSSKTHPDNIGESLRASKKGGEMIWI